MRQLLNDRMFPLTIQGLDKAMRELVRYPSRAPPFPPRGGGGGPTPFRGGGGGGRVGGGGGGRAAWR